MAIQFENSLYLFGLSILPFIVIVHFYLLKDKKRKAMRFANFETIQRLTGRSIFSKNILQLIFRIFFTILIILGFSGPTIGYKDTGTDYNMIIAIDASGSMLAKDLEPTRFEAVKAAATDFVNEVKTGGYMGVIGFGGMAYVEIPPTDDLLKVSTTIRLLDLSAIPGTAIGDAVQSGVMMFQALDLKDEGNDMIIIITDGQENILKQNELFEVVSYAKKNNIIVNIIGVGSPEGSSAEIIDDVESKFTLNEELLTQITERTDGEYVHAMSAADIRAGFDTFLEEREVIKEINISGILFIIALIIIFIEWNLTNFTFRQFP